MKFIYSINRRYIVKTITNPDRKLSSYVSFITIFCVLDEYFNLPWLVFLFPGYSSLAPIF